jgi:glycosyltransferase involved in cell wall biosynthesis
MTRSLSVIVTAMNESGNLEATVANIIAAAEPRTRDLEILVVDDGSTDGTAELADRLAAADGRIRVHHNDRNRGLAFSYKTGIALAANEFTCWIAGNNIVPRSGMEDLFDRAGSADAVFTYIEADVRGWFRRSLSRAVTALINLMFGLRLRYFNGPPLFRTDVGKRLRLISEGSAIMPEVVLRLIKTGGTYVEIPLQPQPRTAGVTKSFRPRNLFAMAISLARLFWDMQIRGRRHADAAIVAVILAAGIAIGAGYRRAYDQAGGLQDVPTREFGAAIAMTCGRGFVNPGYELTPAFGEFLDARRDTLSCSDLPATLPPLELSATQRLYRYLMVAAALTWKITGLSWSGLRPLYAIAYGLTLAAAYGIFRLGLGRLTSVAATAALAVSAVHLQQLPSLRDYLKAPFILASMLIMGRLAVKAWSAPRALAYAALFGLTLGIGFGFRNDLLIVIVPWIVVMFFATPGAIRGDLKIKVACVGVAALVFIAAAWPILVGYSEGSNTGHVTLLGLMTPFDAPLGVGRSIYDEGYVYLDGYASALVHSYALRQYHEIVINMTRPYDRAAAEYVSLIARHFPADLLARAYGSMLTVLELPFAVGAHVNMIPVGVNSAVATKFYVEQARVLHAFNGLGVPMAAATLVAIGASRLRAGVVLLVLLIYFAGYPALQFHVRHYFHLEFIGWFALGFVVERTLTAVLRRRAFSWEDFRPRLVRGIAFTLLAAVILEGSIASLRAYQSPHVRRLLRDDYLSADREPVETKIEPAGGGRVLVATRGLWPDNPPQVPSRSVYLAADFSGGGCGAEQIFATFRYKFGDAASDFSHEFPVRVERAGGPTRLLVPVFQIPGSSEFAGIELPAHERGCLTGVYRIKAAHMPKVLLDVNAAPGWERARLYQTIDTDRLPRGFGRVSSWMPQ